MIPVAILWGASVQKDVSNQIQSILEKSISLDPNYTLKGELLGFYAQLEGLSRNTSQPNETALVSGQLTRMRRGEAYLAVVVICAMQ